MFGQGFNYGFLGKPLCFTDTTDIFKDNSGVALYTLDYDGSDSAGATGKFNEGGVFNGSSSYIDVGSSIGNQMTSAFTVSLWVNVNNSSNDGHSPLSFMDNIWINIFLESDNTVYARLVDSSASSRAVTSTNTLIDGGWNHIVFKGDGTAGQVELYLNNVSQGTASWNGTNYDRNNNNVFGQYGQLNVGRFFEGKLDQVRIFNKELSSTEISTLYNETKNTTNTLQILGDTSCIATYPLDGSSTDLSGNYNGTDTNILYKYDGTPTAVDFGVGGKTLYGARFNGSSSYIDLGTSLLGSKSAFSVSAWVNFDNLNTQNFIFYNSESGTGGNVGFYDYGNGSIYFQPDASTSANRGYISNSGIYTTDEWVNIVMVFDGSATGNSNRLKAYIQGTERTLTYDGTIPSSTGTSTANNWIGGRASTKFSGDIDQVRVFNKALSSAEVSKLYGNGAGEIACEYTSTTDNVAYPIANTAYYKLDNNSKDSARSTGKFNEGAIFNGSSSNINTTIPASVFDTDTWSISLWLKHTDTNFGYYAGTTTGVTVGNGMAMGLYGDGARFDFVFRNGTTTVSRFQGGSLSINTWTNIVVVSNNNSVSFYQNGSLMSAYSSTFNQNPLSVSSFAHSQPLYIGRTGTNTNSTWGGVVDQVRIFNKALTSSEVTTLYNENKNTTSTLQVLGDTSGIATYKLDGNSSDLSGNYNGTDTNIIYAYGGTEANIEYRFGRFGQAAVFNGSSSKIVLPTSTFSPSTFTLSAWCNVTSDTAENTILELFDNQTYPNHTTIVFAAGSSGYSSRFLFRNYTTNQYNYNPSGTVQKNVWKHYAMTYDGSTVKSYIDGSLVDSGSLTLSNTVGTITSIQLGLSSGTRYLNGAIDQVRIFSSALTSTQVTKLYNEKPEVDTSNFKAVLYKGTSAEQYISNVGMDLETNGGLVWMKSRNNNYNNTLYDSVRGTGTSKAIYSNETVAENAYPTINNFVSFDANGFTVGATSHANNIINKTGDNLVAWNWKAGGLLNKSASFNGSNSKISLSTISNIKTYSFWINPDSSGNATYARRIFGNIGGTSYTYSIVLDPGFGGAGEGRMVYYENTSAKYGDIINFNEWSHIAFTSDGTTLKIYTNGSLSNTYTTSSFVSSINEICSTASNRQFKGKIDQVRIYNTALDSTDVSNLYAETASSANTLSFPSGQTAIATYKLDGNSTDLSGNYSGTDTDVAYAFNGTESNIEYRFGKYGQAAVFNGSSSKIVLPTSTFSPSTFTLSAWCNVTSDTAENTILELFDNQTYPNHTTIVFAAGSSGYSSRFLFRNYTTNQYNYNPSGTVQKNVWKHYAMTYDGSTVKSYIDGSLVDSGSLTLSNTVGTITSIQLGLSSGTRYLNGAIDQVRIFSSALTSTQVTKLYNEKPEVDTSNFKAVLYKGTSAEQYISNVGMDLETNGGLVWMKSRNNNYNNTLYDSVRGTGTSKAIYSNETVAENAYPTINNFVSFDANGFTVGATSHANNIINKTGDNLVAWNWKAGGLLNKSASFNGSNSKISLSTISNIKTYSFWINPDSSGNATYARRIFGNIGGTSYTYSIVLDPGFGGAGEGRMVYYENTSAKYGDIINFNEWSHIAFTSDGTTLKIYTNGSLSNTYTTSGFVSSINEICSTSSNRQFKGSIDQVRIFNKAISPTEVATLYNETKATVDTLQVLGDTSCMAAYPLGVGAGDIGNTYSGTPTNVTFNNPGHLTRNTSGTIESTVSANTGAGFSIVKYSGNNSVSATVGHGLSDAEIIILKDLTVGTNHWRVWHKDLNANSWLYLSLNLAQVTAATDGGIRYVDSNTFGFINGTTAGVEGVNYTSSQYIAYVWKSISGYSKIGTYEGNAGTQTVACGFEPSFVMMKNIEDTTNSHWLILDSARSTTNPRENELYPNLSNAGQDLNRQVNFVSNGFELTSSSYTNRSGIDYIFMAFK